MSILLGTCTAVLGLLFAGGLAVAGPADRWYLLRWVNHFLSGTFAAAPLIAVLVVGLLLAVFGGVPFPPTGGVNNPRQSLILQSTVLMGMIVRAAIQLAMMWDKVRHADLPTGDEK